MTERESVPTRFVSEQDPFRDFLRSPMRFSRLLESPLAAEFASERWAPAMDVSESKDSYVVTMEIPGAKKEDVSVELHDNVLTIKGEKHDEREEKGEHRHVLERSYGSFSRSFRLPPDTSEDIQASFRDGVLTVSVQKHEERKPRTVAIDS